MRKAFNEATAVRRAASHQCGWVGLVLALANWATGPTANAAVLETMKVYSAGHTPAGSSTDSPQVTLYNTNGFTAAQATVSEGGAVDWSQLTYVSGDHYMYAGNPLLPADPTEFLSFCIELTQDISLHNTYKVDVIDLASAPKPASGPVTSGMGDSAARLIEELWAAHFHDIFYTGSTQNDSDTQNTYAAAFQLAIWKLEYDQGSTLDFAKGSLQITRNSDNASVGIAENWIAGVVKNDGKEAKADLMAITGHPYYDPKLKKWITPDFQDQVVEVIQEPSTMVLWAFGALGMAKASRRRRRRRGE